jgi:beta-galactosidase
MKKVIHDPNIGFCSSYDNDRVTWGDTVWECYKRFYEKYPDCCGMYLWTGIDYIGEPTPYRSSLGEVKGTFPSRSSQFGLVDLAGFEKDVYYKFQSLWTDVPMIHVAPTDWESWTVGESVRVDIYSNCTSVELFLNGSSVAKSDSCPRDSEHCEFSNEIPFAKGELKAVGYDSEGNIIATDIVKTSTKSV